jgi:RNA polymerase sigma-70 factor, ECF subfamily
MSSEDVAPDEVERLLAAAREGEESSFTRLVAPHQRGLHAHCYRMLGSVHDADDALQDALLRAWRAIGGFEGRSSLRSWLYRIATNASIDLIGKRRRRVLPIDFGPARIPEEGPGEPVVETAWVEPYPDERLGLEDGLAGPEATYERREGVELAFVAALQHLPATQRAALIICEVLGFSAKEAAAMLETSVASVNSALQRARKTLAERTPEQTQQATMRALGDEGVRELVDRYLDAWDREDIEGVLAMLTDDACFSMPPLASWFGGRGGREQMREFLGLGPLSGEWRWRHLPVRAGGQPALGFYSWYEPEGAYLPFGLNVLTLEGSRISDVTAFVCRSIESSDDAAYARWPEEPLDGGRVEAYFTRFGLPARLD